MIRNNRIGFDLPVDNLKTGKVRKVRNTFPTTYGKLDIFQVSLPHFTRGASCLEKGGELVEKGGRVVLIPALALLAAPSYVNVPPFFKLNGRSPSLKKEI
jgi:hypothetical protein